jgi:biopolymer transport protein ExbB/TolQ
MLQQLSYFINHPEEVMYPVATILLYPVLLLEGLALLYIVFEFGRFTLEVLRRDRKRSIARIEAAAADARKSIAAGKPAYAVEDLGKMNRNWLIARFAKLLGTGEDLKRARLFKLLAETEMLATKRLDRTRMWIRLGPIIGLITTLIPISPALVALAAGDLKTLSNNLVIAFSTTVIGLLISGLAFVMSATRERLYLQDISDIEYALELLEVPEDAR